MLAPPADFHTITLPSRSVIATIVLLKDVLMCAWPTAMFLRALRRARLRAAGRRGAGGNAGSPVLSRARRGPPESPFFGALPPGFFGPLGGGALGFGGRPRSGVPRGGGAPRRRGGP